MQASATALARFLDQPADGLFYTGHASVLVKLRGRCYLFDMVKNNKPYGNNWFFFPELVTALDWSRIDGVFVSHCHQDHFDVPFLQQMRGVCPLYVLDGRPEFNALLAASGLDPVLIPPETRHALADGVEVYGFLHETNGVDGSFVIASPDFSVYHGNDNYMQPERLQVLKTLYGGIDVGCIPYAYINWYPFLLNNFSPAEKAAEAERLIHLYYDLAIAQAQAMGARMVIPFGANLVYFDDAYSEINLSVKTPIEFEAYARRKLGPEEGARYQALFGGDTVIRHAGALQVDAQPFERDAYRDLMQVHLQALAHADGDAAPAALDGLDAHLAELQQRVASIEATDTPHEVRVEAMGDKRVRVAIDLRTKTVRRRSGDEGWDDGVPSHHFYVQDPVFAQWLRSEIRFEEIIGSRRFTLSRFPNQYRPDILRIVNTGL